MDMSLYPFCSFFVCLPEAISINNLNISSVIFSKSLLSINSPALKSIQLLFLFARRELEATLIVGTLAPSWLQPNGWAYANTPSQLSPIMSWPIFSSLFAVLFTQPTVGIIPISFLVSALPSCRKYPLKVPCAQRKYRLKAWPFYIDRRFLSNSHLKSRHLPKRQKRCHCVWL